jgi:hypothetical protein
MTYDPLHDLIRQADASVAPPRMLDLVSTAPVIARRRRNTRRVIIVVCGCLLLSMSLLPRSRSDRAVREVAELDAQVESQQQLAEQLWRREREHAIANRNQFLQRELDQAAYAMVYQADRISNHPNLRLAAADFYQQVLTDFPDSLWAPIARQRLAHLHDRKEG